MDLDKANMSEITNAQMGKEFVSKSDDRHTSHNRERFVILLLLFGSAICVKMFFVSIRSALYCFSFFTIYAWHGWMVGFFFAPFSRLLILPATFSQLDLGATRVLVSYIYDSCYVAAFYS